METTMLIISLILLGIVGKTILFSEEGFSFGKIIMLIITVIFAFNSYTNFLSHQDDVKCIGTYNSDKKGFAKDPESSDYVYCYDTYSRLSNEEKSSSGSIATGTGGYVYSSQDEYNNSIEGKIGNFLETTIFSPIMNIGGSENNSGYTEEDYRTRKTEIEKENNIKLDDSMITRVGMKLGAKLDPKMPDYLTEKKHK